MPDGTFYDAFEETDLLLEEIMSDEELDILLAAN